MIKSFIVSITAFLISFYLMGTIEKPIYGSLFFILGLLFLLIAASILENNIKIKEERKFKHITKPKTF